MFGTQTVVKKKKVEPIKVFRFCILGSPETGKTSLCTLYNTNRVFSVYKHTVKPKFFCRDFSTRMLNLLKHDPVTNGDDEEQKKKKKKKKKRGKKGSEKPLDRYGVQMVDVPGEVHKDVAPNTEEIKILTNQKPTNHITIANDDSSETASLLVNRFTDKQNRLHDLVLPHAFVIVFDLNEVRSFEKALTLARFIRDEPNNALVTNNPIFFFGNKMDSINSKEDLDRSWSYYQNGVRQFVESVKTDSSSITRINKGTLKLNIVDNEEAVGGNNKWTLEEYIDDCCKRLNKMKLYSTGDNELSKKRRTQKVVSKDNGEEQGPSGTGSAAVDREFCAFCCSLQ